MCFFGTTHASLWFKRFKCSDLIQNSSMFNHVVALSTHFYGSYLTTYVQLFPFKTLIRCLIYLGLSEFIKLWIYHSVLLVYPSDDRLMLNRLSGQSILRLITSLMMQTKLFLSLYVCAFLFPSWLIYLWYNFKEIAFTKKKSILITRWSYLTIQSHFWALTF